MKVPITHRVYFVSGFILSGWLFITPWITKLPDETVKQFAEIKIPDKHLKRVYFWLELKRKIKGILKK